MLHDSNYLRAWEFGVVESNRNSPMPLKEEKGFNWSWDTGIKADF